MFEFEGEAGEKWFCVWGRHLHGYAVFADHLCSWTSFDETTDDGLIAFGDDVCCPELEKVSRCQLAAGVTQLVGCHTRRHTLSLRSANSTHAETATAGHSVDGH